jgi:hypothetical protein
VTADLSVSPVSGVFRENLTFAGTAFAPNESVQIYVRGVGSSVLASAMADASGAFTVTARAPQSPYGPGCFWASARPVASWERLISRSPRT